MRWTQWTRNWKRRHRGEENGISGDPKEAGAATKTPQVTQVAKAGQAHRVDRAGKKPGIMYNIGAVIARNLRTKPGMANAGTRRKRQRIGKEKVGMTIARSPYIRDGKPG